MCHIDDFNNIFYKESRHAKCAILKIRRYVCIRNVPVNKKCGQALRQRAFDTYYYH